MRVGSGIWGSVPLLRLGNTSRRHAVAALAALLVTACAGNAASRGGAAAAATQPLPIVVIGATAQSAPEILRQALAQGRRVTAIARRPEAIDLKHPQLRIVKADVRDVAAVTAALRGDEVVVSLIGPRVDPRIEVTSMDLYTVGTRNIIEAMRAKGNRRLLATSSIGAETTVVEKPASDDLRSMWLWNGRKIYEDMRAMETLVRASGLDYTILRPGFLVERPAQRNLVIAVETDSVKAPIVTFADFAEFVLQTADSRELIGKRVGIGSSEISDWGRNLDFQALLEGRLKQGPVENRPTESR
jgi:nucleoside-diphosphate-sugar epimerase